MPDLPDLAAAVARAAGALGVNGIHRHSNGNISVRLRGRHAARTVDLQHDLPFGRDPWVNVTVWYAGARGTKVEDRRSLPLAGLGGELAELLDELEDARERKG